MKIMFNCSFEMDVNLLVVVLLWDFIKSIIV